ncbi:O-antigen ligase family protein [Candidatus Daviesbacteria bacterium]|nr:O-antigen ligase family protein [Candidatus Daviesbacteria bacterium]
MIVSWILTLAITLGQLIKLPLLAQGGATFLDLTVILLCLFGLLKLNFKLRTPPIFLTCAFIFIFIAMLSLIFTPLSLKPTQILSSFLYTVRLAAYFLLGWLIYINAFPSLKQKIPAILISSGFLLSILGLLQFIFLPDLRFLTKDGWDPHYFRTASTFLDPNFLAGFFAPTLILITQIKLNKLFLFLTFIPIYLGLLTTFSRGGYLAFLIGFLTLSLLNKSLKLVIISLLLFAGLLFGFFNYQKTVAGPRNIDRTQSAEFRLNTWQQGLSLFQQAPVLGIGYNSYPYALRKYRLANEEFLKSRGATTNDSSLLFVAAATGIIGLTFYLFFLANLLEAAWQKHLQNNIWGKICSAGVLAILAQSLFANTLFYPFILIWIILVSAKLSE